VDKYSHLYVKNSLQQINRNNYSSNLDNFVIKNNEKYENLDYIQIRELRILSLMQKDNPFFEQ
jgi:hypothetical protein